MKTRLLVILAAGLLAAGACLLAQPPKGAPVPVKGTLYGTYSQSFEGNGAWVGHAVLVFGDKPPRKASMVDRGASCTQNKDGSIKGSEIITLTFLDGSGTLDIDGRFDGLPGRTPCLFTLRETGTITRGTGKYAHVNGRVKVEGPFLFPDTGTTPGAAPWIAELHGTLAGVE